MQFGGAENDDDLAPDDQRLAVPLPYEEPFGVVAPLLPFVGEDGDGSAKLGPATYDDDAYGFYMGASDEAPTTEARPKKPAMRAREKDLDPDWDESANGGRAHQPPKKKKKKAGPAVRPVKGAAAAATAAAAAVAPAPAGGVKMHKCGTCKVSFPQTKEHFFENKKTKSGFYADCVTCYNLSIIRSQEARKRKK